VIKSIRYKPTINETYVDFAEHDRTTILPARAYKPEDKSLVERAVKILYRRIYVHLREKKKFRLDLLNEQI
jgi:transposase